MTVRVLIENDIVRDGVRIFIRDTVGDGASILLMNGGKQTKFIDRATAPVGNEEEFALLQDHVGMALRDALIVHYGGAPETQWLRKDYDAERARVDKLINSLLVLPERLRYSESG